MSAWQETYEADKIRLSNQEITIFTAVKDSGGAVGDLAMTICSEDFRMVSKMDFEMAPAQMRALAALLEKHATRLEQLQARAAELRVAA